MSDSPSEALTAEAAVALTKAFGQPLVAEEAQTMDDLRRYLTHEVTRLLDRQPGLLMHVLYRVDVDEAKVKAVFRDSPPDRLAADLAELLIERQLIKLRIRRRYQDGGPR